MQVCPRSARRTAGITTMELSGASLRDGILRCAAIRAIVLAVTHTKVHIKQALKLTCFIPMLSQVTLPGEGQSFAWMYSIEDPAGDSKFRGCGAQVSNEHLFLFLSYCCSSAKPMQTEDMVRLNSQLGPSSMAAGDGARQSLLSAAH